MTPQEAQRAARIELGGIEQVKEQVREERLGNWLRSVLSDCRYGVRQLHKNPGFTLTVIFTLALSIGANTAIFSMVNALMLKGLPYSHPERMGTIFTRVTGRRPYDERHKLNGERWESLRDNVPSLISAVSSPGSSGVNLQAGSHVEYLHGGRVSAHYLDVLAVEPIIGRNFSADEDRPHGPKTSILSYSLWRNTFGSNPNILGQAILLKGEPYTVIGVLPDGCNYPLERRPIYGASAQPRGVKAAERITSALPGCAMARTGSVNHGLAALTLVEAQSADMARDRARQPNSLHD
jgi:hypothetical protein